MAAAKPSLTATIEAWCEHSPIRSSRLVSADCCAVRRSDCNWFMTSNAPATLPEELAGVYTLAELFAWRVRRTPMAEAYRYFDEERGQWVSLDWHAIGQRTARFVCALRHLRLPLGARVALLLPNGVPAVCLDQAILALNCVPVPIHALDNPSSIAYILSDSDASVLFAASETQWQAIARMGATLPALQQVIVLKRTADAVPNIGGVSVLSLGTWERQAPSGPSDAPLHPPVASDLAALVYTSGTTGRPKGVMLSHDNVLSNVKAVLQRVLPAADDVFLSFLPLSHTLERTAGYYLPVAAGCCVAFSRSTKLLMRDLQTVRPTLLISVPRIYERVYVGAEGAVAQSSMKRALFEWAQEVGWRRFSQAQRRSTSGTVQRMLDALIWPLLKRMVARPLQNQFGGRLRLAVSGGAPLSSSVARCFLALGVPILQGYGMTETSPVVAVNTPEDNDPSTVGRVLPGVDVRIGENEELLVRGPNVMRGYWKREADTALAFVDGWLRTGDQASIEAGRLCILGRVKEIIVTSTGEKIAPADLEQAITADPAFEAVYAFGDNRPFIACVVVLSASYWQRLSAELGLKPDDPGSLQAKKARNAVLQRITALTAGFPRYAQPRAVVLSLEPWTIENTLMTPTLKLKRNNLAAHFAAQIEYLYTH